MTLILILFKQLSLALAVTAFINEGMNQGV